MTRSNTNLNISKKAQYDEFYTLKETVEGELRHYTDSFQGKTIYCNCDNPAESNFCWYFLKNFNQLKMKRFIATSYSGFDMKPKQLSLFEEFVEPAVIQGSVLNITSVGTAGVLSDEEINDLVRRESRYLDRNGDFASPECRKFMDQADIIVTNPPFSEAVKLISMLLEAKKQFLILGNYTMIKSKKIFPYYVEGRLWIGVSRGRTYFKVDSAKDDKTNLITKDENKYAFFDNIVWLTNLPHTYVPPFLNVTERFSPERYPKYDTYDAIDVNSYKIIPHDYDGIMGVPINILLAINPKQFQVVGEFNHGTDSIYDLAKPIVNGKEQFPRIAIRRLNHEAFSA